MGSRILINEGANQLVIDKRAKWSLRRLIEYNDNADADKVEAMIDIFGDEVQSSPGSIWTAVKAKEAQALKLGPQRVQLELDGNNHWDFKPSECINSPVITSFELDPEPGAGYSRWKYRMGIYVKTIGKNELGTQQQNVENIDSKIEVEDIDGLVVSKTWDVRVKGKTTTDAYNAARRFKPTGTGIVGGIVRAFQQNAVHAVWNWSRSRVLALEESVDIVGAGDVWEADEIIGRTAAEALDPLLNKLPRPAQGVIITGAVEGTDRNALRRPQAHLTESGRIKRQRGLEHIADRPAIKSTATGMYRFPYQEIYIVTGGVPALNHSDHVEIPKVTEPGDGPMRIA